jgi:large subunit ribosomal protein L24
VQVKKSQRRTGAHIRTQPRTPIGRLHVKKGDIVEILAGNDKGKTGEVKEALPRAGRVIVEGVNLRWRHKKPSQQNPKGERVQREAPIHASNVRLAQGAAKPSKKAAAKAASPKTAASKGAKKKV